MARAPHRCEHCNRSFDFWARADKRFCDERCRSAMRRGNNSLPCVCGRRSRNWALGWDAAVVHLGRSSNSPTKSSDPCPVSGGLPAGRLNDPPALPVDLIWKNRPVRPEVAELPENDPDGPWAGPGYDPAAGANGEIPHTAL